MREATESSGFPFTILSIVLYYLRVRKPKLDLGGESVVIAKYQISTPVEQLTILQSIGHRRYFGWGSAYHNLFEGVWTRPDRRVLP